MAPINPAALPVNIILKYIARIQFYLKSLDYSFVPFVGIIWLFVYVLAAQTSAGQAGPKFNINPPKGMNE